MRFLATCACERIIIDRVGAHSLIAIMSRIDIAITPPPDMTANQLPPNAIAPKEWFVFSMWEPEGGDFGKEFEQVIEVFWPNEEKILSGRLKLKPEANGGNQLASYSISGFPVGQQGRVKVLTWLEQQGRRVTEPFPYYISVNYVSGEHHPPGTPHSIISLAIPQQT
jgi:hypothetical protein